SLMADQHDVAAGTAVTGHFDMYLGHQRTRGVEYLQAALCRFVAHRLRDAVRAEDHGRAGRHFVQLFHEYRAALAQVFDHEPVVHDLVTDIDRRAERFDRPLDDLDGAVDAGAEATWIGENDVHGQN